MTTADTSNTSPEPASSEAATTLSFQAEVRELLHLVVHSLYANPEVFLRELVSNASDALDKGRFLALTQPGLRTPDGELGIDLELDDDKRTLVIRDNGVGLTRDEAIRNLGTIAKSGSAELMKKLKAEATDGGAALKLIGQFGVGFYAAFMVASRVDVDSLSMQPDAEPVLWRSSGTGEFSVQKGERSTPGTTITLHLKDEAREYTKPWRVKDLVAKYSDFVSFPIRLGGEVVNRSKPLWSLPKSSVTPEQHKELFHHLGGAPGDEPAAVVHLSIDAPVQFQAVLYVPSKAPADLWSRESGRGVRLYAKRVLIQESCDKLLPPWLRFVRGVVDSEDLSLNVSRELLQENRALSQIEAQLVKAVLKALRELAESEPAKYAGVWTELGRALKEGVAIDFKSRDAIAELCRFETMLTVAPEGEAPVYRSLDEYVEKLAEGQTDIFYLTGPTRRGVLRSPHLEAFRKKGLDVLLLCDPIDEWLVQSLPEWKKHKLKSVVHGDIDVGEEAKGEAKDLGERAVSAIAAALGDRVKGVRLSKRLTETAACLVAEDGSLGANMERILRMMDDKVPEAKRILELNPESSIVQSIGRLAERDAASPLLTEWSEMLLEQALLADGVVEDPARLVRHLQALLAEVATQRVAAAKGA